MDLIVTYININWSTKQNITLKHNNLYDDSKVESVLDFKISEDSNNLVESWLIVTL